MTTIQQLAKTLQRDREANPRVARLKDKLHNCYVRETYRLVRKLLEWPTQAMVARVLYVDRAQIGRRIEKGLLKSNEMTGRLCRIDPASFVQELHELTKNKEIMFHWLRKRRNRRIVATSVARGRKNSS